MKPGFLTDSFPVEFLNQVDNKKKKEKIEEHFMFGVLTMLYLHIHFKVDKKMILVACSISNLKMFINVDVIGI